MKDTTDELGSVTAVLSRIRQEARSSDRVSLGDIVSALGEASFVPVLMAPALAVVTPLSGIPLFSSFCGLFIALVSIQMILNRDCLWLPDWLLRRRVDADRVLTAIEWFEKPAAFLDRHSRRRLRVLVARPFDWITELACLLCGAMMPFFEIVPFTSSILGAGVVLFSLSLLVRDGLYSLLAMLFLAGAGTLVWSLI